MKKSMFMSTVAMIIVVVVAMSTATFAWFSTFKSVESKTNIVVGTGGSGLEIREENAGAWAAAWTNILPDITIGDATLVAPQTDIEFPAVTDVTVLPATPRSEFYAATAEKKTETHKLGGFAISGMSDNGDGSKAPFGYKQFQVKKTGETKAVTCKVTINAHDGTSAANASDILAMASTKVVLVAVKGTNGTPSNTNQFVLGEAFNWQLSSAVGTTDAWDNTATSVGGALASGKLCMGAQSWITAQETLTGKAAKYATAAASTYTGSLEVPQVPYNEITPGVKYFKTMTLALGDISSLATDVLTVRAYIWNDGHTAKTGVAGGRVNVTIEFITA